MRAPRISKKSYEKDEFLEEYNEKLPEFHRLLLSFQFLRVTISIIRIHGRNRFYLQIRKPRSGDVQG
jgi:hypothetical protein